MILFYVKAIISANYENNLYSNKSACYVSHVNTINTKKLYVFMVMFAPKCAKDVVNTEKSYDGEKRKGPAPACAEMPNLEWRESFFSISFP